MISSGDRIGISSGYVDELLCSSIKEFKIFSKKTHETFSIDDEETLPVTSRGFNLSRNYDRSVCQYQLFDFKRLGELPETASLLDFRSMRMKLAWLSNTSPDYFFGIS